MNFNSRIIIGRSVVALSAILITGCSTIGHRYVPSRDTVKIPEKPGKYERVTESDRLRGELNAFKSCYDVTFYDLNIDVNIEEKSIRGWVEFRANALETLDTIQFDLNHRLKISSIRHRGSEIPYYRKADAVFAILPSVQAGGELIFRVDYYGQPVAAKNAPWDGGFVWTTDKNKKPWVGVACEGEGASLWWPNKDHPSEEPDSMRITITTAAELTAIANGRLREIRDNPDFQTRSFIWVVNNPINNYNVTLNIGDYVEVQDTLQNISGTHRMSHMVLSYNRGVAETHFLQARDVLHVFEKYYGPYPWWEDGYKLVETPYRGMEHQSAVAYGNGFKNSNNYYIYDLIDYVILHETAHEWWGNNVSACDGADVWLHEAFATYSEVIYLEEKLGRLVSVDYLMNKRRFIRNSRPMVGPRNVNYWGFDDVYWKGAWVLHTLRSVIDDDPLFFDILYQFQVRYTKSIVCTEDFIQMVNQLTGEDYTYFFSQYLFTRKPPVFSYLIEENEIKFQWTGVEPSFRMPMYITVNKRNIRIQPSTDLQSLQIPVHSTIEIPDRYFYMAVEGH